MPETTADERAAKLALWAATAAPRPERAAVLLLERTRCWLGDDEFWEQAVTDEHGSYSIDWNAALRCASRTTNERARTLMRLASSIGGYGNWIDINETLTGLGTPDRAQVLRSMAILAECEGLVD